MRTAADRERVGFADIRPRPCPITSNKRLAALAGAVVVALLLVLAPAAAADAGDPLLYSGGPVAHSMTGYVVDWGPSIKSLYSGQTGGDPGLIKYLAANSGSTGDVSAVLAQYMDSSGANAAPRVSYGGQYEITPSINPTSIYDPQIQKDLVEQIKSGALPQPAAGGLSTIYLLLFPTGQTECLDGSYCSGSEFCAYHGDAHLPDGTPVLYAVLPDNTTGAMSHDCGSASTPLQNQTSFLSHEWAESITDPLVADGQAYTAWYDGNCPNASSLCGEVADKCNQMETSNGPWTVQLLWSNLDSACVGNEPSYAQPTASFTSSTGGLVGQPVSVDGSPSSDPSSNQAAISGSDYSIAPGIASYAWNWGDPSPSTPGSTSTTQTHTFSEPGTYQVSLTVTDNLGFISTVTEPVEVSSLNPSPPTPMTGSASGVDANSATLGGTIDTGGQPVTYSFVYGTSPDPATLTQSTTPTHLGPTNGPVPISSTAQGLTPMTTYYYQLMVQAAGQTYYADNVNSFTTAAATTSSTGTSGQGSGGPQGSSGGSGQGGPPTTPGALQLPSASTGGVSGLTSSSATVSGGVDPNGSPTTYLVEYGKSTAYGHSSRPGSAGAGTAILAISASLSGLRAKTLYHYRVVATNAAGTAVGADRTFRTPAAPPPPPRFSFTAPARITLARALGGKLRVRFHCSAVCTAHFTATISLPGVQRFQALPAIFARGTGRVRLAGSGQATLFFTGAARNALRRSASVKLVISGYAVRGRSAPSAPRTARLLLTR